MSIKVEAVLEKMGMKKIIFGPFLCCCLVLLVIVGVGFLCASVKCVQFQLWGNRVFPLITRQIGFHWRSILSDESAALTAKEGPHKYHCFLYFSPHSLLRFQPFLCHIHPFWPPRSLFSPFSLLSLQIHSRQWLFTRALSATVSDSAGRIQMNAAANALPHNGDGLRDWRWIQRGGFKEKANFSSNFFQKRNLPHSIDLIYYAQTCSPHGIYQVDPQPGRAASVSPLVFCSCLKFLVICVQRSS